MTVHHAQTVLFFSSRSLRASVLPVILDGISRYAGSQRTFGINLMLDFLLCFAHQVQQYPAFWRWGKEVSHHQSSLKLKMRLKVAIHLTCGVIIFHDVDIK